MKEAAAATDPQSDLVGEEFLRLGAHQNVRVLVGVLLASGFMAAIAAFRVGVLLPACWLVLVVAVQWLRVRVQVAIANPATGSLALRLRRRVAIAVLCGGVEALVLVAFPALDVAERAIITVVLLGMATGAVANSAGYLGVVAGFGAPMLLPLVLLWAAPDAHLQPAWAGLGLGALILFHSAILHGFAQVTWRTFENSCRIRFKEQDLNERLREALAAAQAANQAKTRFLAAASHDLRQPLHTVVLLTSALGLRPLDDRSQEIVSLLNEVTEMLSAQLDDLLDISKLDAGVVEANLETVAAADLLAQHFQELQATLAAKGLEGRLERETTAHVCVDPQLFARVLRNLTHNAVKFTDAGSVTLSVRDEGPDVVVAVADTGCGIAPEHRREVFEEFFQASNPERDRSKGLGLGLSIVERLCRLQGIRLKLESEVGHGTVFELRLPRATPPRPAAAGGGKASEPDRYGLHVLVVDDEMSVRAGMRLLLEELGCSCQEASGTAQACEAAVARRPDLVLADFRLRGDDSGLETLAALEVLLGSVTGVLVTGDVAPERLREARASGRKLLHKPVTLQQLRDELRVAQAVKEGRRIHEGALEPG